MIPLRGGYKVELVQVARLMDKSSWLFRCPLNGCDHRATKLYLSPGGRYFGCRECYGLTYRKRQEHDKGMDVYRRLPFDELAAANALVDDPTPNVRNLGRALRMLSLRGWM